MSQAERQRPETPSIRPSDPDPECGGGGERATQRNATPARPPDCPTHRFCSGSGCGCECEGRGRALHLLPPSLPFKTVGPSARVRLRPSVHPSDVRSAVGAAGVSVEHHRPPLLWNSLAYTNRAACRRLPVLSVQRQRHLLSWQQLCLVSSTC